MCHPSWPGSLRRAGLSAEFLRQASPRGALSPPTAATEMEVYKFSDLLMKCALLWKVDIVSRLTSTPMPYTSEVEPVQRQIIGHDCDASVNRRAEVWFSLGA